MVGYEDNKELVIALKGFSRLCFFFRFYLLQKDKN